MTAEEYGAAAFHRYRPSSSRTLSPSRGACCVRALLIRRPLNERAQGRPGAGRTHGPPAKKMQAAGTTGLAEQPAFPAPFSIEGVPISKARTRSCAARRRCRDVSSESTRTGAGYDAPRGDTRAIARDNHGLPQWPSATVTAVNPLRVKPGLRRACAAEEAPARRRPGHPRLSR